MCVVLGVAALLASASGCNSDKPTEPDPAPLGPADTIVVGSDTVSAGDTAVIVLNLTNTDSAVASFNLHLQPAASGIVYDTASVMSPRFPSVGMVWATARHDSLDLMTVVAFLPFQGIQVPIAPGGGPILSIRYAVDSSVSPGVYLIDTSSALLLLLPPGTTASPLGIAYEEGLLVPPVHFVPGQIVVQ